MTDEHDLRAEKQKLLAETRADLLKRQLSNAENYDKAIVSLATAFLGFSFVFLKDLVPATRAVWLSLLYISWSLLTFAVLSTIVSFWVSQKAINVQLKRAEDYYLHDIETALSRGIVLRLTDWVNVLSGVLFVLGVACTTTFVILNFQEVSTVSKDKSNVKSLFEGAPVPKLQQVPSPQAQPETRAAPVPQLRLPSQGKPNGGAPVPGLQQAPSPQPQPQTTPTPAPAKPESAGTQK
jgi:hypothetical protein